MRTVKDYRDDGYEATGSLSNVARSLAFAGVAIVWIFKQAEGDKLIIPRILIWALCFFSLELILDLFQYSWKSAVWSVWARDKEKKHDDDYELLAPIWFNWPTIILFWGKVICVLVGYIFMCIFLSGKLL